jgi:hypothetical protein
MVPAAMGAGGRVGSFVRHSLLAEDHDLQFPPGTPAPTGAAAKPG